MATMVMTSTRASCREASQLTTAVRPSAVKSMWFGYRHGSGTRLMSLNVCGSRKSRLESSSGTTIALVPSGVKYRLYGSVTEIGVPGCPVRGSIGVSAFPRSLFTYNVRRSHEGTTCCGRSGTEKWLMI